MGSTQAALKDVNRLLKLDPKNTEMLAQKQKLLAKETELTTQKLKTLKEVNQKAAESAKNYDAWKQAYTPIQNEITKTKDKLGELKKAQQGMQELGEVDTEEYKKLQEEIKATQKELRTLQAEGRKVTDEFGNPISPEGFDSLQREIAETEGKLKSLREESDAAFVQMGQKVQDAGGKMKGMGEKLLPVTAGVASIGAAAVKTAADFEAGMSEVAAISGASEEELSALTEEAKRLGAETKFSASDAAEGLKYMAMAGWDTKDMLGGLEGVMKLAAASGEDLGTVSDIVTDSMTAFGLSADESARFADVLAQASSKSNTNVRMMGETFKYVAPVAGAMGYSIEDTATAIGLMANAGIKGSQAGISLRSILTRLAKPPKDAAAAMDELGLSITTSDGKMKPLDQTLTDLRSSFAGLTQEEQIQMAANLAGQEAMSGLLAIVNASDEDFAKLTESINNSTGAADKMSATMQDNLAGRVEELKSKVEGIAITFGETLIPIVEKVVGKLSDFADWLSQLSPAQQEMIVKIAGLAAVLGPLLIILGQMSTGIGSIIKLFPSIKGGVSFLKETAIPGISQGFSTLTNKALPALGKAFSAVFSPTGLIITAVVAAVALIATKGDEIQAKLQQFDDWLQGVFAKDWTEVFGPVLGGILNGFLDNVKNIWDGLKQVFDGVIDFIRGVFTGDWERAWNGVKEIFRGIFDSLVGIVKAPINGIISILNGAINGINKMIDGLNSISIDIPDWVPGLGGKTFGFNIGHIGNIPLLAKGGILSKGSAIVGEAGPELLTMQNGRAVVQPLNSQGSTTNNNLGGVNINVYGAPGQNVRELAEIVMEKIETTYQGKVAVFGN